MFSSGGLPDPKFPRGNDFETGSQTSPKKQGINTSKLKLSVAPCAVLTIDARNHDNHDNHYNSPV